MSLPKNIALVHDWLVTMRGGEKCFEVLCELFPHSPVFTLVHKKGATSPIIENMGIRTSFIQSLPFGVSHYQRYLPIYPRAIERFDVRSFDLVISSSHAVAKGVRVRDGALHVCYCHTPMRYIWDQFEIYFGKNRARFLTRAAITMILPFMRTWDVQSSTRVHHFIANSENVRERIQRIYNRSAEIVHPPVDVHRFSLSKSDDGYFLIVSALVPYKRIDLAIEVFNTLGKNLVIVGSGIEEGKLKLLAKSNIEFVGWVDDTMLAEYYEKCRALIFPGEEDFGIAPIEAMACGKPVVALARGGALETVVESEPFSTGVFFHEQTADSLIEAIQKLERRSFDAFKLREHALQFDRSVFKRRIQELLERWWMEFRR